MGRNHEIDGVSDKKQNSAEETLLGCFEQTMANRRAPREKNSITTCIGPLNGKNRPGTRDKDEAGPLQPLQSVAHIFSRKKPTLRSFIPFREDMQRKQQAPEVALCPCCRRQKFELCAPYERPPTTSAACFEHPFRCSGQATTLRQCRF